MRLECPGGGETVPSAPWARCLPAQHTHLQGGNAGSCPYSGLRREMLGSSRRICFSKLQSCSSSAKHVHLQQNLHLHASALSGHQLKLRCVHWLSVLLFITGILSRLSQSCPEGFPHALHCSLCIEYGGFGGHPGNQRAECPQGHLQCGLWLMGTGTGISFQDIVGAL